MHQPDGGGARKPLAGGPERKGQYNGGTASVSQKVDELNQSMRRPLRCVGCGRDAGQPTLPESWFVAWIWADFGSVSGVFAAALCPSCSPRIDEPAFRRRFDRTVAAMARDDIESALTGGAQ